MAAMVEAHAEHRVAGLDDGKIRAEVRAGTGMGLHVGVLRAVQLAGAVAGKVLHHVDLLAAAVVALAGVPFAYLLVSTLPTASMTAREVKFSDAMSSTLPRWRASSWRRQSVTCGSSAARNSKAIYCLLC